MRKLLFLLLFVVAEGHVYTHVQNATYVSIPWLPPQMSSIVYGGHFGGPGGGGGPGIPSATSFIFFVPLPVDS